MKATKYLWGIIVSGAIVVISTVSVVLAAEGIVPPISVSEFSEKAHWFWGILFSPIFASVLTWLIKFISDWVAERKAIKNSEYLTKLNKFASIAIVETYEAGVRAKKDAGTFTEADKIAAFNECKERFIQYCWEENRDVVKEIGHGGIKLLIETILGFRKSNNGALPLSSVPMPDSYF